MLLANEWDTQEMCKLWEVFQIFHVFNKSIYFLETNKLISYKLRYSFIN